MAGLGKAFNRQDARSTIAIHQNYGVGCDVVDPLLRTKAPTILKKAIQQILLTESLGKNCESLYVAVTRAKEKLYLSGSLKNGRYALKMERRSRKKQLPYLEIKMPHRCSNGFCVLCSMKKGYSQKFQSRKYSVDDLYREKLDEGKLRRYDLTAV